MRAWQQYLDTCREYMYLPDEEHLWVIWAAVYANRLDDDPVWLHVVAPASYGKTTALAPMSGHDSVVCVDVLTAAGFISGWDSGSKGNCSLAPRLDGLLVLMPDFTSVLGMPTASLKNLMGQLRRAYDGELNFKSGNQTSVQHMDVRFGLITAVTDAIDSHRDVFSDLGERFLVYRMPTLSAQQQKSMAAMRRKVDYAKKKEKMQLVTYRMLDRNPREPELSDRIATQLTDTALIAAMARTSVKRDRYTKSVSELTRPESCVRLSQQLCQLAKGMAMITGKRRVGLKEVSLVQRAALHTVSFTRYQLLRLLMEAYPEMVSAEDLAPRMGLTPVTVERHLEDLGSLRLLNGFCETGGMHYRWVVSEQYGEMLSAVWQAHKGRLKW